MSNEYTQLQLLASLYGIQTQYEDCEKKIHTPTPEVLLDILQKLQVPIAQVAQAASCIQDFYQEKARFGIEPVTIFWENQHKISALTAIIPKALMGQTLVCCIMQENNQTITWTIKPEDCRRVKTHPFLNKDFIKIALTLPALPLGYHHITLQTAQISYQGCLIVAPKKASLNEDTVQHAWGLFAPLYSLRSQHNLGCGDLGDLAELAAWSHQLGAAFIGSLPINAIFMEGQHDFSPYSPISKLFWNELYLNLAKLSFTADTPYPLDRLTPEITRLKAGAFVNYSEVYRIKRAFLQSILEHHSQQDSWLAHLQTYAQSHTELAEFARFKAQHDRSFYPDQDESSLYRYHLFVQWQMDWQLKTLKETLTTYPMGLYLDTPIGTHPQGYDVHRYSNLFSQGLSIGNPPDIVFTQGQNWQFPPLNPKAQREGHYQYLRQVIRKAMQAAHYLRIDHVMGLHRLFVIPKEASAREGTYLNYPAEEHYAIWCLESVRHQVTLIGENLGTVPPIVNKSMSRHGFLQMYIAQYEWDGQRKVTKSAIPKNALVSLNTHDMPTFAAFAQGLDLTLRADMKLLAKKAVPRLFRERQQFLLEENAQLFFGRKPLHALLSQEQAQSREEKIRKANPLQPYLAHLLTYLASGKHNLLLINIEDLWLETQPQNIPTAEYPSWKKKLQYSLEELKTMDNIKDLLTNVAKQKARHKKLTPVIPFSLFSADDVHLFNEGTHAHLYQKMGAHVLTVNHVPGVYFAVWAPNAQQVSVIGDFNDWQPHAHALRAHGVSGIWEGFIPQMKTGDLYKFHIDSHYHQQTLQKNDPFAYFNEVPPNTASRVWDLNYTWQDEDWLKKRHRQHGYDQPISIYEVHLGSWRRAGEAPHGFLSYREIAPLLAQYVKNMGFTHVELLPIMEHPFYGSWGYQTTNYFAPTARYGTPQDLMYLIDYLHQHDIGVILDWVPSHFPSDEYALHCFDGTHLFEHEDPQQRIHPDWQSDIFNYERNEVRSFLISSALFWLDYYHADGLRVDAVASMLYLDYSRKPGEWRPNIYGGNENLSAIAFIKKLNETVYHYFPDTITIAEESTSWLGVSKPTYLNGLGFGYKWDMGWMHDTLHYLALDPIYRRYHHNELSFRMIYAYHENFVLPLSHDEVVHGKGSLLRKMPGYDSDKFANLRILFSYLYTLPGKKHLFMGMEFAQWEEWHHEKSLDWHLLEFAPHQQIQRLVTRLNQLYRQTPALFEQEMKPDGFEWVAANDCDQSVFAYLRKGHDVLDQVLVIINATPLPRAHYCIGVPLSGTWRLILNTDEAAFGGTGVRLSEQYITFTACHHGQAWAVELQLPPLSTLILQYQVKGSAF